MLDSVSELRKEYLLTSLDESDVDASPFVQFERWFEQISHVSQSEANAMVLATSTSDGAPSARAVLLKGVDEKGFRFFTGRESRKGQELAVNPKAALLFHWPELERQVRLEGIVEELEDMDNLEYFQSRPRGSQIAAHIQLQSRVVPSRETLEQAANALQTEFEGKQIPPPRHWGGYRLVPSMFEFWQGRQNRLHDRLRYRRGDSNWIIERLGP